MPPAISPSELASHNTLGSLWIAVDGLVYDFTDFAPTHPGGLSVLLEHAGKDGTEAYRAVHAPSLLQSMLPASQHLGHLSSPLPLPRPPTPQPSTTRKPPLSSLISVNDFRLAAHTFLPPKTLAFVSSAATDCHTHHRNSTAYSEITLRPRVLVDVSAPVSLATTILGQPVSSPVFVSPTSLGKTVHPEGEREIARACRERGGVAQVISTSASFSVADVVQAALDHPSPAGHDPTTTNIPVFLQLYVDKHAPNTEALLHSLTSPTNTTTTGPKIKGVFLTVDAPVPGKREADERIPSQNTPTTTTPMATQLTPLTDTHGSALGRLMASYISPSLTWTTTLPWLRSHLPPQTPLVIKGIQTAADAVRAVEAGVDGILLSNHGGRSVDGAPAAVVVLLELQRCCPGVGVGRGVLYGLGYGKEGVKRVLEILDDELVTTMKMCGVTSLDQLHPGLLNTRAIDHLVPDSLSEEHPYAKWRRSKI
ncbi:FMN-dependent dehydrogenase-domain-containing protein [Chaetomium fimeti]|uniref:FMN-dependent dehydrogenase-domain-containing protein n=1 Tax=Chaetomium fimeti TaxID=1854472 RepID=A0AAE0LVP1_9PEZI|nr:FMN-dependent dehydrogenase-domain-containing protein [Chaetomium fimeti]